MASEIYRERQLGNFKPPRAARLKAKARDPRADREGDDDKHRAAIRKLPCAACLRMPAGTIHHLKSAGHRGMSLRAPDKLGVPLCPEHHEAIERAGTRNEFATFAKWGIADVYDLAAALWGARGDLPVMTKIVLAHKGVSR